jgi:23S rRNA (uridine2552-2'-O)-methyltransferase
MPRKPLPEKARRTERKRTFGNQRLYSTFPTSAPVKEDQEIDVLINDIGSNGDGMARIQNFPIFVPKTKAGEHVKIRITKVGGRFAVAERLSEKENEHED